MTFHNHLLPIEANSTSLGHVNNAETLKNFMVPNKEYALDELGWYNISEMLKNVAICLNQSSNVRKDVCQSLLGNWLTEYLSPAKITLIIFYILLFVTGLSGNIAVILCVLVFRHMRSLTNVFLLNLALSDLLVFLICEPWVVGTAIYSNWIYGEFICKFHAVIQGTCVGVSVFTLTSISVERYVIIIRPMKTAISIRTRFIVVWVLGIWLLAFLICSPLFFAYEIIRGGIQLDSALVTQHCVEFWSGKPYLKQIFTVSIFATVYLLPVLFMTVIYIKFSKHLLRNPVVNLEASKRTTTRTNNGLHKVCLKRRRISVLLLILLIVFIICWIPYHVTNLFVDFYYDAADRQKIAGWVVRYVYPTAQFLAFANSAVNPFCTLFVSEKFRNALRRLRRCHCFNQREQQREALRVKYVATTEFSVRNPPSQMDAEKREEEERRESGFSSQSDLDIWETQKKKTWKKRSHLKVESDRQPQVYLPPSKSALVTITPV